MAKAKLNQTLVIVLVALAVVGYSFLSSGLTGGATAPVITTASKTCMDSDGQNTLVKGSCTDDFTTKTDKCVDYDTVNEAFCSQSKLCSQKYLNCQYGSQCVDGACVKV